MSYSDVRLHAAGELRAEMARRRYTSTDLGTVLGISQQSASRRMTGEMGLNLDEVALIADWLGIDPTRLIQAAA